jgi:hypothetical protein
MLLYCVLLLLTAFMVTCDEIRNEGVNAPTRGPRSLSAPWQSHPLEGSDCHWKFNVPDLTSEDGERILQCSHFGYRQFTAKEARERLKGKHIVLIGDSHMRFQFDALAVFLETGVPQSPLFRPKDDRLSPLMPEVDVRGGTGGIKYRQSSVLREEESIVHVLDVGCDPADCLKYSNKYYHNASTNVTISYFGLYGYAYGSKPLGWLPEPTAFTEKGWGPGGPETLAELIRQQFGQVDEIIVNVGQWRHARKDLLLPWILQYDVPVTSDPRDHAIFDQLKHFTPLVKKVSDPVTLQSVCGSFVVSCNKKYAWVCRVCPYGQQQQRCYLTINYLYGSLQCTLLLHLAGAFLTDILSQCF